VNAVKTVRALLRKNGIKSRNAVKKVSADFLSECEIAIAIGGDGTMLRAARSLTPHAVPLLGINAGGLGFLSAVDLEGFKKEFGRIFSGVSSLKTDGCFQWRCGERVKRYSGRNRF